MNRPLRSRVLLLGACVVAGSIVGVVGQYLSGSSAWFLAVPALLAVAWLFVANPTECLPPAEHSSPDGPTRH